MQDFRRLRVWANAHALTLAVYGATTRFPAHERFELATQLRRAASSIAINIAEGCGHHSDRELQRFLQIAMGSASEVEYELLLARELHLLDPEEHEALNAQVISVKRKLARLLTVLRSGERSRRRAGAPTRRRQRRPPSEP